MASGSVTCGSHRSSRMTSSLISASVFISSPVLEVHAALLSVLWAPGRHITHPDRSATRTTCLGEARPGRAARARYGHQAQPVRYRRLAKGDRAMTIPLSPRRYPRRAGSRPERDEPATLTDEQLMNCVMSPLARCAGGAIDPDEWFPVSTTATAARAEAAHAL